MKHILHRCTVVAVCALFVCSISPHAAHAYLTTAQKVVPLDNGAQLFLIEYAFSSKTYDIQMPILAYNTVAKSTSTLSYTIVNNDNEEIPGKASGFIFSNAHMMNNTMYSIPKGTAEKFILAVVFIPTAESNGDRYRLQVNYLPFNFNGQQQLKLNPSELQYYTTPYANAPSVVIKTVTPPSSSLMLGL